MPLLQDTGSQLFYCLLSTLSISIESILYLLNLPCLTSASLVRRESGATAKLSPVMDVESGATYVVVSPSPWRTEFEEGERSARSLLEAGSRLICPSDF